MNVYYKAFKRTATSWSVYKMQNTEKVKCVADWNSEHVAKKDAEMRNTELAATHRAYATGNGAAVVRTE